MNLKEEAAAAARAAKRSVVLAYCLKNPNKTLNDIAESFEDEGLQDVFGSLTPSDFVQDEAPAKKRGPKKGAKKKAAAAPVAASTKAAPERATKPQVVVTTGLMQLRNNADIGDKFTMVQLRERTAGTAQQLKAAMKKIGGFETEGKGKGTVYVVTENAVSVPDDEEEVDEEELDEEDGDDEEAA